MGHKVWRPRLAGGSSGMLPLEFQARAPESGLNPDRVEL